MEVLSALAERLNDALPQTQCTRCGYPDCRTYAAAMARGEADLNQCPPGGQEGIERLAALLHRAPVPLNPANGVEAPRMRFEIDEAWCIGCTLCVAVCPVDCIVGAQKQMHTVIEADCTGCALCLPACPVDCIVAVPASGERTGWAAWSQPQADAARRQYTARVQRIDRAHNASALPQAPDTDKRGRIAAALARARAQAKPTA